MTSFFEHQRTSYKRSYLRNLIALASSDGRLGPEERDMIFRIGLKRGLKPWQIEAMLDDPATHEVFLPESVGNRMNMLYDLMQIIYADNNVDENELEFLANIVGAFHLHTDVTIQLTGLFQQGTPTAEEWEAFVATISSGVMQGQPA
jgi:uncharacterized tellurite resistance protein B-like protein